MLFRTSKYSYLCKRSQIPRIIAVFLVTFGVCIFIGAQQIHQYFFRTSDAQEITFTVDEGESLVSISARLADADIIPSAWWFRVAAKLAGLDGSIRAGSTVVIPGDRSADILGALRYPSGESEVSITIPEGYTLAQIGATVRAALPHITTEEWQRVTGVASPFVSDTFIVSAHKPTDVDLEGYLFPDTYRFFKNATTEDVVERMLRTMETRIEALDTPSGDATGMTTHELITLSSIIEREVRKAEEMREVADIFLKRLDIGMALQSDATVNYVTGGDDPSISLTDRDLVSPYNTYQNPGLPPGPISNPGMNALRAVWNPAQNDYYYFLTDAEGNVYYAVSHDEHVRNKAQHL